MSQRMSLVYPPGGPSIFAKLVVPDGYCAGASRQLGRLVLDGGNLPWKTPSPGIRGLCHRNTVPTCALFDSRALILIMPRRVLRDELPTNVEQLRKPTAELLRTVTDVEL